MTLRDCRRYRIQVIDTSPNTPAASSVRSLEKPSSPARSGIRTAAVKLARESLVRRTIESTKVMIIRSTCNRENVPSRFDKRGSHCLFGQCQDCAFPYDRGSVVHRWITSYSKGPTGGGLDLPYCFEEINHETWILIDDAQLAVQAVGFWQVVIMSLENFPNLHVVLRPPTIFTILERPLSFLQSTLICKTYDYRLRRRGFCMMATLKRFLSHENGKHSRKNS